MCERHHPDVPDLLARNRAWADARTAADPGFFKRLVARQSPPYLWIGCSDSRVPANEIVGLDPGEMFVHRNIANLAPPQDANFLSVLQYAVQVLKVRHILVVGHYGCGGVRASFENQRLGLIDHWLSPIRVLAQAKAAELAALPDDGGAAGPPVRAERAGAGGERLHQPVRARRLGRGRGPDRARLVLFAGRRAGHRSGLDGGWGSLASASSACARAAMTSTTCSRSPAPAMASRPCRSARAKAIHPSVGA